MSRSELLEHASYFSDRAKLEAYERALAQLINPGDVVVDLGSGTGLLGLMAARAGAGRVYMIDSGPVLGVATEVAAQNGFADRVIPVRAHSNDVDLPELADVVVCDQIGGLVYDAGVFGYFADARRRMLKPGGHLVPHGFTLYLAPVRAPEPRERVDLWERHPHGFDTAALHRLALNTEWRVDPTGIEILAPGAAVATVSSWNLDRISHTETFEFDQKSTVDGLLGWFDAELAPGVRLTNAPGLTTRMHRWCNFYPSTRRLEVEPGDTLTTTLDIRPEPGVMNWAMTWTRGSMYAVGGDNRPSWDSSSARRTCSARRRTPGCFRPRPEGLSVHCSSVWTESDPLTRSSTRCSRSIPARFRRPAEGEPS